MTKKQWRIKKEFLSDDGCFARGGGLEPGSEFLPENDPSFIAQEPGLTSDQLMSGMAQANGASPMALNAQEMAAEPSPFAQPQAPIGAPVGMPQQQQMQPGAPATAPSMGGMDQMIRGYQNEASTQGKIATEQANLLQEQQAKMQDLQNVFQQNYAKHETEVNEITTAMKDGRIDPDRYMNSQSTGSKVGLAIGLLLGGLGQGLAQGKENRVLTMIQGKIKDDINAQIENRKGKENLLTQLEKQYGNKQQALTVLNSVYSQQMANRIQEAALRSGSPMAQARADQIIGQLRAQSQQGVQQAAQRSATYDAIKQGHSAEDLLRAGADPKLISEQFVPGMGLANSADDKKKLVELKETIDPLMQSVAKLKTLGPQATVPGTKENQQAKALAANITLMVKSDRIAQLGVLSGPDMGIIQDTFTNPAAFSSLLTGKGKTDELESWLNSKLTSSSGARLAVPASNRRQQQQQSPAASNNFGFKPKK